MNLNPENNLDGTIFSRLTEEIKTLGRVHRFSSGDIILLAGDRCDFFFFVESGACRAFRWLDDGEKEVTIGFSFRGDIDTCPYAFVNDTPSSDTIEALTECKIIKVRKQQLYQQIGDTLQVQHQIIYLLSHYIETLIRRTIELKTHTAEDLYQQLVARDSDKLTKIPLKHIASYLGISQERLSRIRKKLHALDLGQIPRSD